MRLIEINVKIRKRYFSLSKLNFLLKDPLRPDFLSLCRPNATRGEIPKYANSQDLRAMFPSPTILVGAKKVPKTKKRTEKMNQASRKIKVSFFLLRMISFLNRLIPIMIGMACPEQVMALSNNDNPPNCPRYEGLPAIKEQNNSMTKLICRSTYGYANVNVHTSRIEQETSMKGIEKRFLC